LSCIHRERHDLAIHDAYGLLRVMQIQLLPSSFASPDRADVALSFGTTQ